MENFNPVSETTEIRTWPAPKRRHVGRFTDLRLFSEALNLAYKQDNIVTRRSLMEEMPQRLKGLLFVESQSPRGMEDLIKELHNHKWLSPVDASAKLSDNAEYRLTDEGRDAFHLFRQSRKKFLDLLTTRMHDLYIIPGWFVHRLWAINPEGQGEVVIPSPCRDWHTTSRKWEDSIWTRELATQTGRALEMIRRVRPGAFPIQEKVWIEKVEAAWNRLSLMKRKKKVKKYAPRRRLYMAMKEAAIRHLFSKKPPNSDETDFLSHKKEPLYLRIYEIWVTRMEGLELIFYTDSHPLIPGRLIFPTSVFRHAAPADEFEMLEEVRNPRQEYLWIHRPMWESKNSSFFSTLVQEHQRIYNRIGSLYVPLLDVRDEVCRQLRLSAACFDDFMEKALRESLYPECRWSVSVETDIREDQTAAHRLIRRPVWIRGIPYSLIAVTELRN